MKGKERHKDQAHFFLVVARSPRTNYKTNQSKYVSKRHLEEQLVEKSVVAKANAGIEPDTVVVVAKGASLTNAAVVHSLELKILTFGAILHAF